MNHWPEFCDAHKRWFDPDDGCDHCYAEYENRTQQAAERIMKTARGAAIILTQHAFCKNHLITDMIWTPVGSMSILDLQMLAFTLEHEEIIR